MKALTASILALLVASPAQAAKSCGQKVVDDWYGNSVVDGVYPLHCYRDALKLLPDDAQTYSSAPEDIRRALNTAIREQQQTPPPPASPSPSASPPPPSPPATTGSGDDQQTTTSETLGAGPVSNGGDGTGSGGSSDDPSGGTGGDTSSGIARYVLDKIGPESADALPLPVLIIGGLALLLLAAGSAGLVARRLQARKVRASAPPVPPRRPGPSS